MFQPNQTVFILGAGASWHYGYPTGEELVKKVSAKASHVGRIFELASQNWDIASKHTPKFIAERTASLENLPARDLSQAWRDATDELMALKTKLLKVDPLVIDYFLGWNDTLSDVGKFIISLVLLECEALAERNDGNINRIEALRNSPYEVERSRVSQLHPERFNDNWIRFLLHKLVYGCKSPQEILEGKVNFITFNYDVSLERKLYSGLANLDQFGGAATALAFLSHNRVAHVYGKLREDVTASPDLALAGILTMPNFTDIQLLAHIRNGNSDYQHTVWEELRVQLDMAHDAAQSLRTMAPRKMELSEEIHTARRTISEADCVYILGYGFDEGNSSLLALPESLKLRETKKCVMFTNFGDTAVVNKRASRLFFGRPDELLSRNMQNVIGHLGIPLCEKSTRNVYDALALDFESLEERLLPTSKV